MIMCASVCSSIITSVTANMCLMSLHVISKWHTSVCMCVCVCVCVKMTVKLKIVKINHSILSNLNRPIF